MPRTLTSFLMILLLAFTFANADDTKKKKARKPFDFERHWNNQFSNRNKLTTSMICKDHDGVVVEISQDEKSITVILPKANPDTRRVEVTNYGQKAAGFKKFNGRYSYFEAGEPQDVVARYKGKGIEMVRQFPVLKVGGKNEKIFEVGCDDTNKTFRWLCGSLEIDRDEQTLTYPSKEGIKVLPIISKDESKSGTTYVTNQMTILRIQYPYISLDGQIYPLRKGCN